MNPNHLTLETWLQAYEELQNNFNNSQNEILGLRNQLQATQNHVQQTGSSSNSGPKHKRPDSYKGKGSISSWITHMTNYIGSTPDSQALSIAVSYLEGSAHEWWIAYQQTTEGKAITTWSALQPALIRRFDTLNKAKIARDKLAKWKQMKDVSSFNDDFQKIILDIPNISVEEQIDRYTRGLKPYIWKELCTKEYN